ncbi:DnaJ domain-containing protein [Colletotrichum scovillei]|uniref:Tetratricopeptide repeat and J domain-containing co-chaperone DNJ1 n=1 Tax=Colletotrichum scovillei TaxID=1209932 RepID=A0A9P7QZG3_9PEZI|nr:DnaJ domain-containing protein [Colletotrichum scovillei]KAF4773086.1 DnaJ domain-containing protein [Colletotrichum scovillei]KAG7046832.1 DnaJ domain-containing protein [Colletotrichum scovillei]KAG7056676.1 DnaJ domain-containing protein [Colletotrichum scovillei]KAG7066603.1 DnaJ domain-containing protein [Colletotrichum scovillei]
MYVRLCALAFAASLLSTPTLAISADQIPSDTPVSSLLTTAQAHLSKGQTSDALVYYDAAVARDPSNYLTLFKRATTYLSLGRTNQATEDFNKVLSLKPGFEGAHVQLAKIKSKIADWDGAREQYKLAKKDPASAELAALDEAQGAAHLAEAAEKSGDWEACVGHAGQAIMTANRAISLREMRSRCRFQRGEVEEGMSDLHHVLQMRPGDTTPHIKIAAITFYGLGDLQNGMAQTRKCLHSDPDSKPCRKLLKQQKAIEKTLNRVNKAFEKNQPMTGVKLLIDSADDTGLITDIKTQVEELRADGTIPSNAQPSLYIQVAEMACQGYYDMNGKKAKQYCEEAFALNEQSFYGLLYRAKVMMEGEEFEAAIRSFEEASKIRPDKNDVVQPLMQKAQIALKRSKTKDYYKVLGVSHDADERQIKQAYRKLSKIHHPDKAAKQGLTKEAAEKKMASINEAYEVLSNPELRERFDRGDDPNNQEQQGSPFQGNPFGGGHPFMFQQGGGGGGQQFHFKFGGGGGGGGFPF